MKSGNHPGCFMIQRYGQVWMQEQKQFSSSSNFSSPLYLHYVVLLSIGLIFAVLMVLSSPCNETFRLFIPKFQRQTASYISPSERCGFWILQQWDVTHYLWQTIKGNPCVDVMNVMVTNISSKPMHQGICVHETGRFHGCIEITPLLIGLIGCRWKIVLSIKKIGPHSS